VLLFFGVLPFFSTLLGGWAVLRLQHRLHPIMAFAAGVLVATALVDLLPESLELLQQRGVLTGALAILGFMAFSALEAQLHRQAWEHQHDPTHTAHEPHEHAVSTLSVVGASWLIVHSLLDGLAIGTGFRAGTDIGLAVGLAVLAHDFADGMNVTTLALRSGRSVRAWTLLVLDAIAPPVGALVGSRATSPPTELLGMLLAVFGGAFLALGAGHLLPEAQHKRPGSAPALVAVAILGAALVVAVRHVAG
jgi:ZIP family zinc transporter